MNALIVYGSKHGSTRKIAEEISSVLRSEGFEVEIVDANENIRDVSQYDLVVVGSALQLGTWLRNATKFVRQNQAALKSRPVWLFSSGLKSADPRSTNPKVISEFDGTIKPRGHQFFMGSFEPNKMGWLHRTVVKLPGIRSMYPVGDFRDWNEIRSWARGIADSLSAPNIGSKNVMGA